MTSIKDVNLESFEPIRGPGGLVRRVINYFAPTNHTQSTYRFERESVVDRLSHRAELLERDFEIFDCDALGDLDVFVLAGPSAGFQNHVPWLTTYAKSLTWNVNPPAAFKILREARPYSMLALIDVDIFTDLGEAVDQLHAFRKETPCVPIVIGSRGFTYNEFGTARFPIADTSVKLPISRVGMGLAIRSALTNHQIVLERDIRRSRHA